MYKAAITLCLLSMIAFGAEPFYDGVVTDSLDPIGSGLVFNEAGEAVTFRIETSTVPDGFWVSGNEIGIGGSMGVGGLVSFNALTGLAQLDDITVNDLIVNRAGFADHDLQVMTVSEDYAFWVDGGDQTVGVGGTSVGAGDIMFYPVTGAATFNENGDAAGDFRIESDTEAAAFWTDASADEVGIGGTVGAGLVEFNSATGATTINGLTTINAAQAAASDFIISSAATTHNYFHDSSSGTQYWGGDGGATAHTTSTGAGMWTFNAQQAYTGAFQIKTYNQAYAMYTIPALDTINFGGTTEYTSTATFTVDTGATVLNGAGVSTGDVTIEGDTDTQLLFSDASMDAVGVSGAADVTAKFTVVGTAMIHDGSFNGARLQFGYSGAYIERNLSDQSLRFNPGDDIWFNASATNSKDMLVSESGSVIVGTTAIATTAVDGFFYVPTCAGTPTGTPTTYGATAAQVFDDTNDILYIWAGAAWIALN